MRLKFLVVLAVFSSAAWSAHRADAQILERVVCSIAADYCERNQWPMPYICDDRDAAVEPFDVMIRNGYRAQNMLGDIHFKEKGELTEAGRAIIRSVVYDVPAQHRTIFLHRTLKREELAARTATVEKYIAALAPEAGPPPIQETNADLPAYVHGWPAQGRSLTRNIDMSITAPSPYLPTPSAALPTLSQ